MLNKLIEKSNKDENLLAVGAPGTGKTEILLRFLEHLLSHKKIDPSRIIVFSFNRKWAKFLREEASLRLDKSFCEVPINTFHSFCLNFLNEYYNNLSKVEVLKSTQQWNLLKNIIKDLDKKYFPISNKYISGNKYIANSFTQEVFDFILRAQENLLSPNDVSSKVNPFISKELTEISGIYRRYLSYLEKHSKFNYGLLLQKTFSILKESEKARKNIKGKYDYIIIDELQEMNKAHIEIINLISKNNCIFFGNDDESIYSFRGSMVNNFTKIYKQIKKDNIITLKNNHRSSKNINDLTNIFISQNKYRLKKTVNSSNSNGEIAIRKFYSPIEEADYVCNKISSLINEEYLNFENIAVIIKGLGYETHLIENSLKQKNIPFLRRGSRTILDNTYIRYILDFLKLISSKDREEIDKLAEKIVLSLDINPFLYQKVKKKYLENKGSYGNILEFLESYENDFSLFLKTIKEYKKKKDKSVFNLITDLVMDKKIGLGDKFGKINFDIISDFLNSVKNFIESTGNDNLGSYLNFLGEVAENQFLEELEESTKDLKKAGHVNLLSFHQCKGMEFDAVFIPFINYGYIPATFRFPQSYDMQIFNYFNNNLKVDREKLKKRHYEDERRLFYVGMTRAKKFLYITSSAIKGESPFFAEIKNIRDKLEIKKKETGFYSAEENWGVRKRALVQTYKKNKKLCYNKNQFLKYLKYLKKNYPKSSWWSFINPTNNNNKPFKIFKKAFSYSDLDMYRECPLKYKYSRFFKLEAKKNLSLIIGSAYHKIIQKFFLGKDFKWKKLKNIIENVFEDIELEFKASRVELKEKAIEDFRNFFNNFMPENPHSSVNEKTFSFNIDDEEITGRIDQININNNEIEIVDYKSSASGYSKKNLMEELQLKIYRMAMDLSMDLDFEENGKIKLKYICLGNQDKPVYEIPEDFYNEKDLINNIKILIKNIKKENFKPSKNFMSCSNCDYKILCEYY